MERERYTVVAEELPQHLKRLKVPRQAIVHYWYEVDSSSKKKAKKTLPPQLAKITNAIESSGGLTAEEAKKLDHSFKEFREGFEL